MVLRHRKQELLQDCREGVLNRQQIADKYKVSRQYVYQLAHQAGINLPRLSNRVNPSVVARNQEIIAKRLTGMFTLEELAAEYGMTRERVRQIVNIDGLRLTPVHRICSKCGQEFLVKNPTANKQTQHNYDCLTPKVRPCSVCHKPTKFKSRRSTKCPACHKLWLMEYRRVKAREFTLRHPEKLRAYRQSPHAKELQKKHAKTWRIRHHAEIRARELKKYRDNREQILAHQKAYWDRPENKARRRAAYKKRYWERKALLTGGVK